MFKFILKSIHSQIEQWSITRAISHQPQDTFTNHTVVCVGMLVEICICCLVKNIISIWNHLNDLTSVSFCTICSGSTSSFTLQHHPDWYKHLNTFLSYKWPPHLWNNLPPMDLVLFITITEMGLYRFWTHFITNFKSRLCMHPCHPSLVENLHICFSPTHFSWIIRIYLHSRYRSGLASDS